MSGTQPDLIDEVTLWQGDDFWQSEICAVPAVWLDAGRDLLTALPSLRPAIGRVAAIRKVDRLSCIRFGSARYSVPTRLIGQQVAVTESAGRLLVADTATGEVIASHAPAAPGEASVLDEHYSGPETTWGEVGRTPIVKGTGNRKSVNMISAISPRGKLYFKFLDGNTNAAAFTGFLKDMLSDIPGSIFLIVGGHSAHTGAATRNFVEENKDRLRIFYPRSYSPELNPDEWVWKSVKHDHAGRMAARTID
jgi:transposase